MRKMFACFLIAVLTIFMVACDASNSVVIALDAISAVAAVAPAIATALVAAGKLDANTANLIYAYSKSVSAAVVQANAEWASADPEATKISVIAADFAAAIVPNIPGAPPEAQAAIQAIAAAVQSLLNLLRSSEGLMLSKSGDRTKLTRGDQQLLSHATAVANQTIADCGTRLEGRKPEKAIPPK